MPEASAAPKKRRASGPRTPKPVFAVVRYSDEQGAPVQLSGDRLTISIERDSAKLVEMLTGGGDFSGAAIVRVELPQPQKRNTGGEASA